MELTKQEEAMLNGEFGEAIEVAMKLLTRIGEIYGAKRMVKIYSSHILNHYTSLHNAGIDVFEKFVTMGGRCRVLTTVDPVFTDYQRFAKFPISDDFKQKQTKLCRLCKQLGVLRTWSCTPYLQGNLPRFGEHVAWSESSAVIFANSVLGARTNRLTIGLDIAAAISGRFPLFGLHNSENRIGNILVKMKTKVKSVFDFNTVGYIIGKEVGDNIPVFQGLPLDANVDQLKGLGAAAASSGAVALFHIIGLTPEAKTQEQAFGGEDPIDKLEIGSSEMKKAVDELSTASGGKIDVVAVGCPHYSVNEMIELASLLNGKKIHKRVKFWIFTSKEVESIVREMEYAKIIEASGAEILAQNCIFMMPIRSWGFENIMTNSAKFANVLPSEHNVKVIYRDLKTCVKAAINGEV